MTWQPTMEQRRKYHLTPYLTEDGHVVVDHLAWSGKCSACGERMTLMAGIDRPFASLVFNTITAMVVESSYDKHSCRAQPYRIKRPLNSRDMAHPMYNAHFIPDETSELFDSIFRNSPKS